MSDPLYIVRVYIRGVEAVPEFGFRDRAKAEAITAAFAVGAGEVTIRDDHGRIGIFKAHDVAAAVVADYGEELLGALEIAGMQSGAQAAFRQKMESRLLLARQAPPGMNGGLLIPPN